jgi:hypothetical protein
MKDLNLILHCGGSATDRERLAKTKTPQGTDRWFPVPHMTVIETVESQLALLGMRIVNESYGVAHEGKRMFGILQIANGQNAEDHSWVAGIRNSHDKSFPAGLCVGSGVFVCDNLAFSSEITFGRRHTPNIMRDLPLLVSKAVGQLAEKWDTQSKRIDMYKNADLGRMQASELLVRAMEEKVFPKTRIDDIWAEWKAPRHHEFEDRNVWSFFNCVTENLKPRDGSQGHSLWDLPVRTHRLHAICDAAVGVDFSDLKEVEVALN